MGVEEGGRSGREAWWRWDGWWGGAGRCGGKQLPQNVNTTHAYVARPHMCFFSLGSRLKSSSQVSCVSHKNIPSSHLAQHVARAIVVVSFAIEHYLTFHSFHLHSSPTFCTTIYQTSTDVIFTLGFSLR